MDIKHHTHPDQLTRYSFLWSEVRLVVAAVALFLGGVSPIVRFAPGLSGALPLAWLISGASAVYLLYQWNAHGQRVFGGKEQKDTIAFLISAISGVNLGLVPILGRNIGMSIAYGSTIFLLVGIVYLAVAWYLWQRWNEKGGKIF